MRIKLIVPAIVALTLIGQTAAFADAKSDYMAKCNPAKSDAVAPYCECYYKTIDSTIGIDAYNGKVTDKAKDPAAQKAYGAGMSACAKSGGKSNQ